jgi:hypothetical protein
VSKSWHKIGVSGGTRRTRVLNLPTAWCDGNYLGKDSRVELLAGRVLVVIPPDAHDDAEAIRKLMIQRGFL